MSFYDNPYQNVEDNANDDGIREIGQRPGQVIRGVARVLVVRSDERLCREDDAQCGMRLEEDQPQLTYSNRLQL